MCQIINVKTNKKEKLHVTFEMSKEEYESLRGNMQKIHIFSEHNTLEQSRLVTRGKRDSSKYFLVPKNYRKILIPSLDIPVQCIDTKRCLHIIYSVDKINV